MANEDKMERLKQGIIKGKQILKTVESREFKPGSRPQEYVEPVATIPSNAQPTKQVSNGRNLETSKLPKNILESLKENPPISGETVSGLGFLDEIAKTGTSAAPEQILTETQSVAPVIGSLTPTSTPNTTIIDPLMLEGLKSILKDVVKEVVEEALTEREALNESQDINENFQIKIGESVFGGKITKVKNIKK